ncbi:MAG: GrdX family protein [Clostridium sp.]|nr:GrdX family protein [Clostridium sp.]
MVEPLFIITNNPMVQEEFECKYDVKFYNTSALDVLIRVRDHIHKGYRLLTHPLMSSVKPNETPYRTICLSKDAMNQVDLQSLEIIEASIATTQKFLRDFNTPNWSKKILLDFQLIDSDLIYHAIN